MRLTTSLNFFSYKSLQNVKCKGLSFEMPQLTAEGFLGIYFMYPKTKQTKKEHMSHCHSTQL